MSAKNVSIMEQALRDRLIRGSKRSNHGDKLIRQALIFVLGEDAGGIAFFDDLTLLKIKPNGTEGDDPSPQTTQVRLRIGGVKLEDLEEDNAKIEAISPPEKVIDAFGPEVIGESVEGKVLSSEVTEHDGRTYYQFELEPPHALITATAAGNRLYLFNITGSGKHHGLTSFSVVMGSWVGDFGANAESSLVVLAGLQWKRHYEDLKQIADSFSVV